MKGLFTKAVNISTAAAMVLSFFVAGPAAAALSAPVVTTPANGAVIQGAQGGTVFYSWTKVIDAVNYRFQLDYFDVVKNNWTSVFNYNRGNYTTNYTLMYNRAGAYRVRVAAIDAQGVMSNFLAYNTFTYNLPIATNLGVANLGAPVAQNIVAGVNNVELARIELSATNSGEDIRVSRLTITDTIGGAATYANINTLVLTNNNNQQVGVVANNGAGNTFVFAQPVLVTRAAPVVLTLKGNVASGTSGTHRFWVSAPGSVTGVGQVTNNAAVVGQPTGTGQTMTLVAGGSLAVSLVNGANASPATDQLIKVNDKNNAVFAFKLTATNEAQKLTTLKLTAQASNGANLKTNDLVNLRLVADGQVVATAAQMNCQNSVCTYTWTAIDNLLVNAVQPAVPVTVYVGADIGPAGAATIGGNFKFSIANPATDLVSKGAFSGINATIKGSAAAVGVTTIVPWNVQITGESPAAGISLSQVIVAGTQIARFKITNNGAGQITMTNLKFTDNRSHTGNTTTYGVWVSSEGMSDYLNTKVATTNMDSVGGKIDLAGVLQPFIVNGGTYRYITVTIQNAGAIRTGDAFQLGVSALGDVKYAVTEANLGYDGNADGDWFDTINNVFVDGKPTLGTLVKN